MRARPECQHLNLPLCRVGFLSNLDAFVGSRRECHSGGSVKSPRPFCDNIAGESHDNCETVSGDKLQALSPSIACSFYGYGFVYNESLFWIF